MRVLGIDPGTRHLGWGVVEREGTRVRHVAHGVVHTDLDGSLADRLLEIDDALAEVVRTHAPTEAAVEGIFFAKDAQSAAKLGHARGVVLLGLRRAGLSVGEYPPALVKRTIVGRGAAEKRQVALVVAQVLRLEAPPPADAADALAIAMTHLAVARFDAAIAVKVPRAAPSPLLAAVRAARAGAKKR